MSMTVKHFMCFKSHVAETRVFSVGEVYIGQFKPEHFIDMKGQSFEEIKDYSELISVLKSIGLEEMPNPESFFPTKSEVDKLVEDFTKDGRKAEKIRENMKTDHFKIGGIVPDKSEVDKLVEDYCEPVKLKKRNFFFRQFSDNEINSSDYIKLKNDPEILPKVKWEPSAERHELIDREAYHKLYLEAVSKNVSMEDFMNVNLGIPFDGGKLQNTDYPDRTHFKKKENLLSKVVKWWRR